MENQVYPVQQNPASTGTPGRQGMMPGAIKYMIFGIIACWCCCLGWIPFGGIAPAILGLALGIVAFIKGKRMNAEFNANPDQYKPVSRTLIKVTRLCAIIGLICSCGWIIYFLYSVFHLIYLKHGW